MRGLILFVALCCLSMLCLLAQAQSTGPVTTMSSVAVSTTSVQPMATTTVTVTVTPESTGLPSDLFPSLDEKMHFLFVEAAVMLVMLVVAINFGGLTHKLNFQYMRETAVFLIMGILIGFFYTSFTHGNESKDKVIQLDTSLFTMVLLPPIIFEAGFNLQRLLFLNNTLPILLLAFCGAIYSAVVASTVLYVLTWIAGITLTVSQTLIFGAMISSTDPVTVLSLLPETVDRRLYMLIFGESALNDAVSMILYRFFSELAEEELSFLAFLRAVWSSAIIFAGSIIVGVGVALIFALLIKHVRPPQNSVFQTIMLFVFAYLSYLLADIVGATGVISIFFCGVGMSHYALNNFSDTALLSIKVMLRAFSTMCETFIFLYLGLGICAFGSEKVTYNFWLILFSMIAILISRTHVFLVCGFCNYIERKPEKRIPLNHQILLWFCGLRGAVCFCLGLQILANDNFDATARALIFGTTMVVIVLTVLGMGGLTPFMLKKLKLDGSQSADANSSGAHGGAGGDHDKGEGGAGGGHGGGGEDGDDVRGMLKRDESLPEGGMKPTLMRWIEFDQRFVRPFFARPPKTSRKIDVSSISPLAMPRIQIQGSARQGGEHRDEPSFDAEALKGKFELESLEETDETPHSPRSKSPPHAQAQQKRPPRVGAQLQEGTTLFSAAPSEDEGEEPVREMTEVKAPQLLRNRTSQQQATRDNQPSPTRETAALAAPPASNFQIEDDDDLNQDLENDVRETPDLK